MGAFRRAVRVFVGPRADDGQTMVDYALTLTVITIGVVVAMGLMSGSIRGPISTLIGYL
jgi:Flp pilus assembly pilin Flp